MRRIMTEFQIYRQAFKALSTFLRFLQSAKRCGGSSFGVEWFDEKVLPQIPDNTPVLTVTKGLMDTADGRLLTYPDLWKKKISETGKKISLNAIGGPCTSYELVAHDQTEVSFCGDDIKVLKYLKKIMETDYYHISITTDVTGIESAVALKNGYALGIALTIGLNKREFGNNTLPFNSQAAVFGQAVREMYKLLKFQNALSLNNLCVGGGRPLCDGLRRKNTACRNTSRQGT